MSNPFAAFAPRRVSPKPNLSTISGIFYSPSTSILPDGSQSAYPRHTGSKKRKASPTDDDSQDNFDRMSASPTASPNLANRNIPAQPTQSRTIKRARTAVTGRPLPLSRLLETLDSNGLKTVLRTLCDRHPQLTAEISAVAPKPTVSSSLNLLHNYENSLRQSFPYGGNPEGDYAYNRVKPALLELLDALSDYTPHFLPPNESSLSNGLEFLDSATSIIHRLPNWENPIHNHHKNVAYEEITKAWILVLKETAKRGGGISLQYDGWDGKLQRHNEQSGGRLEPTLLELRNALGWLSNDNNQSLQQTRTGNTLGFRIETPGAPVPLQIW
ncbi:Tethering factor for nuclear proteasome sts1 [Orbilia ellipsospora]|uniref:Tethering factor for nuclear proteasome STS1 n=1 Tax=Orbilia ellipsospora TaxID=2528407 RepID=A0AAV9XPW9_9PEZI